MSWGRQRCLASDSARCSFRVRGCSDRRATAVPPSECCAGRLTWASITSRRPSTTVPMSQMSSSGQPCIRTPEGLVLVSKVGARRDESGGVLRYDRPAQLRRGIEDNLRSLGVRHLAAVNLRLMDDAEPDQRFDDQLAAMVKARGGGLIGSVGLSNVTRDHLLHALSVTYIACVQNPINLADRASMPVLEECNARGIAFVPFFPLGSAFALGDPVPGDPPVIATAARLGHTPAQIALPWLLSLRPNVLLIPGTSSIRHLEENMAVANIELDAEARELLASMA